MTLQQIPHTHTHTLSHTHAHTQMGLHVPSASNVRIISKTVFFSGLEVSGCCCADMSPSLLYYANTTVQMCVHVAVHKRVRVSRTPLLSPSFYSHTSCFFDITAGGLRPNRLFSSFPSFSFCSLLFFLHSTSFCRSGGGPTGSPLMHTHSWTLPSWGLFCASIKY